MNKNELVHLHSLLSLVARTYLDDGIASRGDFAAYHALETTPMALRRSREDHAAATRTLARTLARRANGEPVAADEVSVLAEQ